MGKKKEKMANLIRIYKQRLFTEALDKIVEEILFTNPSPRAGYDARSIFTRILTGLNSEFSFS